MVMENLQTYLKNLESVLNASAATTSAAATAAPASAATPATAVSATAQPVAEQTQPQVPALPAAPAAVAPAKAATQDPSVRLMFVSTHIQQVTGYSKVCYGIIKELAKLPWLQVIHYGFQRFHGLPLQQQPVSPTVKREYPPNVIAIDAAALDKAQPGTPAANQLGFSFRELPSQIALHKPNVVMIYNDMSVVNHFIESIKASGIERNFQIWIYMDQVYPQTNAMFLDVINREADRVFTFTKYWREVLKNQGIHRPIDILHHGFDQHIFKKIPKADARKALGIPQDLFLISSFNRNQPRKRLDILIMAFVELLVKNPSKPIAMLCACDKGEKGGWPLIEIYLRELKLRGVRPEIYANRLLITPKDMSYTDEEINLMYCAADVGISAAEGEGWGLCSFEQMGLGVPQVLSAVGGHKEFAVHNETGLLVEPKWRFYQTLAQCAVGGESHVVDPHDMCTALETYLFDSELRQRHGAAAEAKVATYTWAAAVKTLARRLEQIKEDTE